MEAIDYCKCIEDHPEINNFVLYNCWNTPGLHILRDKNMKRKATIVMLVEELGYFGPIMDLVIRGTVYHMLVCNFAAETKTVTTDCLDGFLDKYFNCPKLKKTIAKWLNNHKFHSDYEHLYRHKRSEQINAQVWFLTQNPHKAVSYICFYNSLLF